MTDFLERDDNYEPAVLPSPGELLHWGDLHAPPSATPAPAPGDDSAGFTRFVRRRRKGRVVAATAVTAVLVGAGAWGVGALTMGSGVEGIGAYLRAAAIVAVVAGVLRGVWRWAGHRRVGDPRMS